MIFCYTDSMNISFFLTTRQFRDRSKRVTRRNGWKNAKPGQVLTAVVKGQGLKKGEHPEVLGKIKILSVRREKLRAMITNPSPYGHVECMLEGFPDMVPEQFVDMYCEHNGCTPDTEITRIEFEYLS
jgi:hypothetical protein